MNFFFIIIKVMLFWHLLHIRLCFGSAADYQVVQHESTTNHLFPVLLLSPRNKRPEQSKTVDFTTVFSVCCNEHLVLFLELKASNQIHTVSGRTST